ncbi:PTS sugar transporter subunit IIA [Companilactobacillus nuruki]|uniref:PTS fructose transporter subunit IIA n=1 Tax=Companilactobacillus nuruki TaxID=1993540 RepID=A0A2N7AS66_9LACO|nr:PTS fructose transporter subunit IIA [Companilactobacillus nuruki]PMD68196.1 PTS fructose transporter subunit IIA [Companilactobacillus nuruki]
MKYLILVSHGEFSKGLRTTLGMFAKESMDSVIAVGLQPDEAVDHLSKRFNKTIDELPENSKFVVLADLIGGSPLTTICNILEEHGKLQDSLVLGGMNFPMALTTLLSKDAMDNETLKSVALSEGSSAIKEFESKSDDSSDDEI